MDGSAINAALRLIESGDRPKPKPKPKPKRRPSRRTCPHVFSTKEPVLGGWIDAPRETCNACGFEILRNCHGEILR